MQHIVGFFWSKDVSGQSLYIIIVCIIIFTYNYIIHRYAYTYNIYVCIARATVPLYWRYIYIIKNK